ncbi:Probably inactive leucine-rich repeat receptor-like protein kinase IMK2 [Linum grandiflorum]
MELHGSSIIIFFSLLALLASPFASSSSSQKWDGVLVTQSDYQSLRAIKNELVDLRGVLRSWNDTGGVCSGGWTGIKCVKGRVIAIQLPWRGLGGKISETIGQLPQLRRISLHDNVLTGSIPLSIGFLKNLRGVYLFNNRLRGSVPASIGNCPFLQALDVGNNSLTGPIPPSLANLTTLYRLNLSHNSFTGSIPASASLVYLALEHNNISGSIPDSWKGDETSKNPSNLQFLTLNNNQITGTIPDELGSLSSLQKLDLSNNHINGTIPSTFPNLSSLVWLNLEGNRLHGQIPEALGRIQNLTVLNLKDNNFSGEIPASISHLSNLDSFNVSYNNLSGPVPALLARKFGASSFVGNLQLCGYSSSAPCPSSAPMTLPSPSPESSKNASSKISTKYLILIIAGSVVAFLLLLCCCLLCCLMRRSDGSSKPQNANITTKTEKAAAAAVSQPGIEPGNEMGGKLVHFDGPFIFTTDDLLCATAEIMGKSSYGTAYKATLEDGNQVAVKRLREKTTKGEHEFESQVAAMGKIRHPNLLALRAYYLGPKGEKLLVFDYMPRGSLSSFLHARTPETTIDWPTRMNIITGIARGLNHLHTKENVIHGNLTSSNVLLDEQSNAHIADFGISGLMTLAAATNVIATAGTLGYRAPELSNLKNVSTKTDVYSLGVIILELLTGKSPGEPVSGMDLPRWVASVMKEEWTNEVFDLEIVKDLPDIGDELLNTLKLALHCVDPSPSARPEVEQVLEQLEEIKPELAAVEAPAAHHQAEIDDGDGDGVKPSLPTTE